MSFSIGNSVPDYYQKMQDKIDRRQNILEMSDDVDDIHDDASDVKTSNALEDLVQAYINGKVDNLDDVQSLFKAEYSVDLDTRTSNARSSALGGSAEVSTCKAFNGASDADLKMIGTLEQKLRLGADLKDDFSEALLKDAGIENASLVSTVDTGNGNITKTYEDSNGTRYTLNESSSDVAYGSQLIFEDGTSTVMNFDNRRAEGAQVTLARYGEMDEDGIQEYISLD